MKRQFGRRDFVKGLGALGVTLGFGKKVISKEVDRAGDGAIQEGVERGLYSQETADAIINYDNFIEVNSDEHVITPAFVASIKDTSDPNPFLALIEHDWSWELGAILDRDFQVHEVPYGTSFMAVEPIDQPIRRLKAGDSIMYSEPAHIETRHEFDHMYCSFIIRDKAKDMWNPKELADLFFLPTLSTFKRFIDEECEGKRLAVQRLPMPVKGLGTLAHISSGGPIPIRTIALYDIASAGTRVNMEFLAKVY